MNEQRNKRKILMIASSIDMVLSGIVLSVYFGILPIDISGWGIPRWVIGLIGGAWFAVALALFVYQLTKTDIE
jgi:hypothetical protein